MGPRGFTVHSFPSTGLLSLSLAEDELPKEPQGVWARSGGTLGITPSQAYIFLPAAERVGSRQKQVYPGAREDGPVSKVLATSTMMT